MESTKMSMPTAKRRYHFLKEIYATFSVALFIFLAACSSPDRTVERKLIEANENIDAGQWENAIEILEDLFLRFPDRPEVAEILAFTFSQAGRHSDAASAFLHTRSLVPERSELILYAADSFERSGDLEEAASLYRSYLADNSEHFGSWQKLGQIEEERGRGRESIEAYHNAYSLRPEGQKALRIGHLHMELGELPRAKEWFETARAHEDQSSAEALLRLVEIEMDADNFIRAEELMEELEAMNFSPLDEDGHIAARNELSAWREAQAEMTRLLEDAAREAREAAELRRAQAAADAREQEEAEAAAMAEAEAEAARQAAALALLETDVPEAEAENADDPDEWLENQESPELLRAPPDASELAEWARNERDAGNLREAAGLYWRVVTLSDEKPEIWFELSRTLYDLEEFTQAEITALEALRRNRESERYNLHYLQVARQTLSMRAYLREIEEARQRFPNNPDLLLALAQTYSASSYSRDLARHYYREFLRVAPQHPQRPEVEAYLRELNGR